MGVNLALRVLFVEGLTLLFGLCLWGGETCHSGFAFEGIDPAI